MCGAACVSKRTKERGLAVPSSASPRGAPGEMQLEVADALFDFEQIL